MTTYKVEGMTCGGCVRSVTNALERALPGVKIEVTLEGGQVAVEGEHQAAQVQEAVEDAGFDFAGAA
jgi:copper chaperone